MKYILLLGLFVRENPRKRYYTYDKLHFYVETREAEKI